MKKHILKYFSKAFLSLALCSVLAASFPGNSMTAVAKGGLNADEQALLNEFAAGITVNGQSLKPPASYVALATDLLSSVDLTTSEVDRLYAKMDEAYDVLRSANVTSVEEAQNSYAKTVVQAITSEAMQILQNSSGKTDDEDDDDDEYEDDDEYIDEDENEDSDPVDSEDDDDDPADEETPAETESETTAEATEESTTVAETSTEAATEAEVTTQEPSSAAVTADNSDTGADEAGFPVPLAAGAAAALVAATGGILFFRHRGER